MVAFTTRAGYRLHIDPADGRAQELIRSNGDFNTGSLELWRRLVASHRWDLVVDVGANYGEMLVEAALPPGAEIVAFEPNERLTPYLEQTLADAGVPGVIIKKAVSDHSGESWFFDDTTWSGTSHLTDTSTSEDHAGMVHVNLTTLDDHFASTTAHTACIKIDVEGHETQVLAGARRLLGRLDRVAIMLEVLHMSTGTIGDLAQEWRMFLYDRRVHRLVRVPGQDTEHIGRLLESGWCYAQDAVLLPADRAADWRPM
jgi:FkbM family methyltransferase